MSITLYTDGGARGNPGPAAVGMVAYDDMHEVFALGEYIGDALTNNWAEYEALIRALTHLSGRGYHNCRIEARLDSKLVVEQVMGSWKIKEPSLRTQHARVHELARAQCFTLRCVHIPREQNKKADALVNQALDAHS